MRSMTTATTEATTATDGEPAVYWTLPCSPTSSPWAVPSTTSVAPTWYIRAYSDGDVVYTEVPPPTGPQ